MTCARCRTPPNVQLTAVSTEPTLISTAEQQSNPRRGQKDLMLIRYGYELTLNCPRPTTMVCLLDAHRERLRDLRYETRLMTMPEIATSTYLDTFGNTVRRFIAPACDLTLSRDAVIEDSGVPDAIEEDAKEGPVEQLPNDTLVFLLGSRYCETDKLADIAWQLFGSKA